MSAETNSLIVTAHPDDETIFFAGLILSRPKTRWQVICVTDGNADSQGKKRISDCKRACDLLGVQQLDTLSFSDTFENRLIPDEIIKKLPNSNFCEVFTHGVLGEYGHPHHQDVSFATHKKFIDKVPVYSVAHNCFPEISISLNTEQWKKKAHIYNKCYFSETQRFIQLLPISFVEGFSKVSFSEVEMIYQFICGNGKLDSNKLFTYQSLLPYLPSIAKGNERPF